MRALWSVGLVMVGCSLTEGSSDASAESSAAPWQDVPAWLAQDAPAGAQTEAERVTVSGLAEDTLTLGALPQMDMGTTVTLTASGADDGARVFFLIGQYAEDYACPAAVGGRCLDLNMANSRILGSALADASGAVTLDVAVPTTARVQTIIDEGYAPHVQAIQSVAPMVSEAAPVHVCNGTMSCAEVVTCIDGLAYPTACGADNCDESIGSCGDACDDGYTASSGGTSCVGPCDADTWLERALGGCKELSSADLSGADLSGADLSGADLTNANLTYADLTDANVSDVTLTGAALNNVTGSVLGVPTSLPDGWELREGVFGIEDDCGVFDSNPDNQNATCAQDCNGDWGGSAVEDACDVCDGDGSTCAIPQAQIAALDATAFEGGAVAAQVSITLDIAKDVDTVVGLTLSGSAQPESDYSLWIDDAPVTESVTLPAGETEVLVTVQPTVTPTMEATETLRMTLVPSATVTVDDSAASADVTLVEYGPSPGAVYHVAEDGSDAASGTEDAPFATIAHGVAVLTAGDTLYIHDGTYTNNSFVEDHGPTGDVHIGHGVLAQITASGTDDAWIRIAAYPDGNDTKPLLRFDGSGGIQFGANTHHIVVEGLEIEGPNADITYEWAYDHRWTKEAFYRGRGMFTWGPIDHIVVRDCDVHHAPGSGIRFNKGDYLLVENNTVSNSTWWSSSAESGIVIATAEHIDEENVVKILYSGNVAYNNWNVLEFCNNPLADSTEDSYGNCDYYSGGIIDGQGLYVTRNNDTYLHGRMRFENNIAFNNGIGGVVYHKTNRGEMVNNLVFMNGAHPAVSYFSGLTVNTADDLLLHNNVIWARDDLHYAIKLNATGTNITTTHNVAVGRAQIGEPDENTFIDWEDAPAMDDWFTAAADLRGLQPGVVWPDPWVGPGPNSPAEIDNTIRDLALDFRTLSTATEIVDAGLPSVAPPTDIEGEMRPLGLGVDVGPYEVSPTVD